MKQTRNKKKGTNVKRFSAKRPSSPPLQWNADYPTFGIDRDALYFSVTAAPDGNNK